MRDGQGERVTIRGHDYRRRVSDATLRIENFRKYAVKMIVRAQFSGELQTADEKPRKRASPDREYGLNQPRELEWTITTPAGDTKILNYSYSYLD